MLLIYQWGHVQPLSGRCCRRGPGTLFRHTGRVRQRERSLKRGENVTLWPAVLSPLVVDVQARAVGWGEHASSPSLDRHPPGCLPWTPGLTTHHLTALASFFSDSLLHGGCWGRKALGSMASVTPHNAPRLSVGHSEHPLSSPLKMLKGVRVIDFQASIPRLGTTNCFTEPLSSLITML